MTGTVVTVVINSCKTTHYTAAKQPQIFSSLLRRKTPPTEIACGTKRSATYISLWPTAKRVARFLVIISCRKTATRIWRACCAYACFCDRYCADATAYHPRAFLIRDFCPDFPFFQKKITKDGKNRNYYKCVLLRITGKFNREGKMFRAVRCWRRYLSTFLYQ